MTRAYPEITVPDHIDNAGAYIRAAHRRIDAMRARAAQAKRAAWVAEDPTRVAMLEAMQPMADFERRRSEDGEPGFMGKMLAAVRDWGSLSENQERAVRESLARSAARRVERQAAKVEQAAADAATSSFVGIVGARSVYSLTVRRTVDFIGNFGPGVVNEMVDVDGNVFVYIGGAKLGDVGQSIKIKATVKRHAERDGVKQTALSRPTIVKE